MNDVEIKEERCARSAELCIYKGEKRHFFSLFAVLLVAFFATIAHAAPPAGTNIPNQAQAAFTVGAAVGSVSSNTAVTVVTGGPTIGYFANNTYGTQIGRAHV